jgi:protein-tyrosine phosphatase
MPAKKPKKNPAKKAVVVGASKHAPVRRVLFLCSGNFYRSRYAEAIFNHQARAAGWPWRAFSRGLSTHLIGGDLSVHTRRALLRRGIALAQTGPTRRPLTRGDLAAASHIVALKESEHRRIIRARFADQDHRVEYWKVHDLDVASPSETLAAIDAHVLRLSKKLLAQSKEL